MDYIVTIFNKFNNNKKIWSQVYLPQVCDSIYSRGRDQEYHSLRQAQAKS
jgi:hypothetical protein